MNVLLSIKPEFAERIFAGTKRYEYRKNVFRRTDVEKIIVYESSPISMIMGEFKIADILFDTPESIWSKTNFYSGTSRDFFFDYFTEIETAFAIGIKDARKYKSPLNPREILMNFVPPQSFMYIPKTSRLSALNEQTRSKRLRVEAPTRFFLPRPSKSHRYLAPCSAYPRNSAAPA